MINKWLVSAFHSFYKALAYQKNPTKTLKKKVKGNRQFPEEEMQMTDDRMKKYINQSNQEKTVGWVQILMR